MIGGSLKDKNPPDSPRVEDSSNKQLRGLAFKQKQNTSIGDEIVPLRDLCCESADGQEVVVTEFLYRSYQQADGCSYFLPAGEVPACRGPGRFPPFTSRAALEGS